MKKEKKSYQTSRGGIIEVTTDRKLTRQEVDDIEAEILKMCGKSSARKQQKKDIKNE